LIGIASAVAAAVRNGFSSAGWLEKLPLFPAGVHVNPGISSLVAAIAIGCAGGAAAWVLTRAVYGAEDAFKKLPIHWVWWPAIGGLAIGIGGLIEPRALGVGYDVIGSEIAGRIAIGGLVSILIVKLVIWALALGSGTSGGILAPILIMGAAVGGIMAPLLPGGSAGAWALLGMGATLAGVTRSPLTAILFAFELTHDVDMLLPLLLACTIAHLASVLTLKRSILTEKVARRGFHVLREYSVGALDALFVRDVMSTGTITVEPEDRIAAVFRTLDENSKLRYQRLIPVLSGERLVGAVPWTDILERSARRRTGGTIDEIMHRDIVTAFPDENLREVAERMADKRLGVLPVVERGSQRRLVGLVTQFDLLAARQRTLEEERHRERVLRPRLLQRTAAAEDDRSQPPESSGVSD
jgi:CBS domain-containing protein